jgi:hypothetical protein
MYNYRGKYLASVSLRREGSSKFGENHKWGSFPAVSLGWRIHNEPFLQNVPWMNELKLRVGYGITGNQDFENYQSLVLMGKAGKFFYNGNWVNSYQPVSNPNKDFAGRKNRNLMQVLTLLCLKIDLGGLLIFITEPVPTFYTVTVYPSHPISITNFSLIWALSEYRS